MISKIITDRNDNLLNNKFENLKFDVDVFEWYYTLFTNHINIISILVLSRSNTWVLVLSFPYLLIEVSMFTQQSLIDIIFTTSNTYVTSTKLLFACKLVLFSPSNQYISNLLL